MATAGVSVAVRTGCPVADIPVGCEGPWTQRGSYYYFVDGFCESPMVRERNSVLGSVKSLAGVHFEELGERGTHEEPFLRPTR